MKILFNIAKTMRTSGDVPYPEAGGKWALVATFVGNAAPVFVWALVKDEPVESTCNPSEADIARRVELLRKTADLDAHPDKVSALDAQHYAAFDGRFFLMYWTEEEFKTPYWCEVDESTFTREMERVAIRQLLSERGAK